MNYLEIVASEQRKWPDHNYSELRGAASAFTFWLHERVSDFNTTEMAPEEKFLVTIHGERWLVVDCWRGEIGEFILLQNGREYLTYSHYLGEFLWIQFAVDATHLDSVPPPECEPAALVYVQRAATRLEVCKTWPS